MRVEGSTQRGSGQMFPGNSSEVAQLVRQRIEEGWPRVVMEGSSGGRGGGDRERSEQKPVAMERWSSQRLVQLILFMGLFTALELMMPFQNFQEISARSNRFLQSFREA